MYSFVLYIGVSPLNALPAEHALITHTFIFFRGEEKSNTGEPSDTEFAKHRKVIHYQIHPHTTTRDTSRGPIETLAKELHKDPY